MSTAAKRTRDNRTITVDFRDEATYFQRLCRKFSGEAICAMVSPGEPRSIERENDDGGELQGCTFPPGDHFDGYTLVRSLPFELPPCRRVDGRTRGTARPRHYPALGREIQSTVGRGVPPAEAPGVDQLADGRDVHQSAGSVALSLSCGG